MSDETKGSNIVQFSAGRSRSVIQKEPEDRKARYCTHDKVFALKEHRMLECQSCGSMVDPFDWVWKWATQETHITHEVENRRKQLDGIKKEVATLAAERDRLLMGNNKLKRQARDVEAQQ